MAAEETRHYLTNGAATASEVAGLYGVREVR